MPPRFCGSTPTAIRRPATPSRATGYEAVYVLHSLHDKFTLELPHGVTVEHPAATWSLSGSKLSTSAPLSELAIDGPTIGFRVSTPHRAARMSRPMRPCPSPAPLRRQPSPPLQRRSGRERPGTGSRSPSRADDTIFGRKQGHRGRELLSQAGGERRFTARAGGAFRPARAGKKLTGSPPRQPVFAGHTASASF